MDSTIFPNPESYDPDRWIRAAQEGLRLDRYLVSFSKGSRMCVGIKYVVEFPFAFPFPLPFQPPPAVAFSLQAPLILP
jgi:Cytochrome P450